MRFHVYQDKAGQWRWRLWAANNRIVADSGEGYASRAACEQGVGLVKAAYNAPIVYS